MAHSKHGFARTDRVNEQIQRELAEIIRSQIKDPRIGLVTLTAVNVTKDYSFATIYYTVLEEDKRDSSAQVLEHAKGFLRSELAHKIKIFKTPQLIFKYDKSIEHGFHISQLINNIEEEN